MQGPPGTGKTRVIVAILSALFATRKRAAKVAMPRSLGGSGEPDIYI